MNLKPIFAGALMLALTTHVSAVDNGQWGNADPKLRDWFRAQKNDAGHLCCDIADGHPTAWRETVSGGYDAMIEGRWVAVPPEAVIRNAGNPVGEAIVWYAFTWERQDDHEYRKSYTIRCFVPGPEF